MAVRFRASRKVSSDLVGLVGGHGVTPWTIHLVWKACMSATSIADATPSCQGRSSKTTPSWSVRRGMQPTQIVPAGEGTDPTFRCPHVLLSISRKSPVSRDSQREVAVAAVKSRGITIPCFVVVTQHLTSHE
jgi:hypothetical protein